MERKNTQRSFVTAIEKVLSEEKLEHDFLSICTEYNGEQKGRDYRIRVQDRIWHFMFFPETKIRNKSIQFFVEK